MDVPNTKLLPKFYHQLELQKHMISFIPDTLKSLYEISWPELEKLSIFIKEAWIYSICNFKRLV